jgi:hypothetical protein
MTPTSHLIYRAAGSPVAEAWAGDTPGTCRLCGAAGQGRPFGAWLRPTFTDHDILRPGEIVCTACLFCAQERTQRYLADRLGKEKGQRFRTYSHFVAGGVWHVLSKASKPRMRELLLTGPEVAVIADSGQKHLVFRARPGWWQFELAPPIQPDTRRLSLLLESCDALYSGGASKAEIESGRYGVNALHRIGAPLYDTHEPRLRPHRGGAMLRLAVFLVTKEMTDERVEQLALA